MALKFVALTVLLIGSAYAQPPGSRIKRGPNTVISSSKCTATAEAKSYTAAQDASVSAVASAIAEGCTDSPDKIVGKFEDIYNSQIAGVVAQAITDVSTTYETEGQGSFGCATAVAYAEAYAKATAAAHAKAAAKAISDCKCITKASAVNFGSASTYIELIASANSLVKAQSCAKSGSSASAAAWQECLGKALVKVFAKATADALIAGGCYDSQAASDIQAETGTDYLVVQGCDTQQASTPNTPDSQSGTSTQGSGGVVMNDLSAAFDAFLNN